MTPQNEGLGEIKTPANDGSADDLFRKVALVKENMPLAAAVVLGSISSDDPYDTLDLDGPSPVPETDSDEDLIARYDALQEEMDAKYVNTLC